MTGHGHGHRVGLLARVRHALTPHSHDIADRVDEQATADRRGMRTVWGSFAVLMLTALVQAVVVLLTGSVALLSDTLHNAADALSAVPIAIAFLLGRRAATRRFTYGFGRAEDLAGLVVVGLIALSAVLAAVEAARRLAQPQQVRHVPAVAAAAVLGFAGNEIVARWRIRVGRRIGSAALVADGLHARADGFTSLAVLLAAGGAAVGWSWVDPVVGLAVAAVILVVLVGAARGVLGRLLDAAEPAEVDTARRLAAATPGVLGVEQVRLRWSGHGQLAELTVVVDRGASLVEAHRIAHDVEHRLLHGLHRALRAHVHPHPAPLAGVDDHALVAHHNRS
ncbi:cation diffusion facilitator family transporter [Longimycelium tulufanense]|nr:cation diffusion facilitator family transporter [Longimycelium tulufanense]